MTDATVEQQGESKRRGEHPEVPQAAESSSSSSRSSSETSAVTEVGLVDVCVQVSVKIMRQKVGAKVVSNS